MNPEADIFFLTRDQIADIFFWSFEQKADIFLFRNQS